MPSRKNPSSAYILLMVALIIAISAVVYFCFVASSENKPKEERKYKSKGKIAEMAPAKPVITNKIHNVEVVAAEDENKRYEDGVEVLSSTITTNANGIIVERLSLANGKKKKKVRPPKPIFDFSSDDLIAAAISIKPGESMPPLPIDRNIDKEFAQSLLSPVRINDNDSDEIKEIKAKVIETRAYLAEEIKRGGTVYDALMAHQAEVARISDGRLMAIQEMQKVKEEFGEDAANDFRSRVNESFRVRGIPEIGIRPQQEKE